MAQTREQETANDVFENKDLAALSYFWCLSLVMYFYKRNSPFVQFHAKQGIVLFVISIIGFLLPSMLTKLLQVIVLFASAWGFLNAAQGTWKEVAFIGHLARGKFSLRESWKLCVDAIVKSWVTLMKIWRKEPLLMFTNDLTTDSTDNVSNSVSEPVVTDLDTMSSIDVPGEGYQSEL